MKRLLPLHEMAVNFGLVSQRLGIHTANAVHIAERLAELKETKLTSMRPRLKELNDNPYVVV